MRTKLFHRGGNSKAGNCIVHKVQIHTKKKLKVSQDLECIQGRMWGSTCGFFAY